MTVETLVHLAARAGDTLSMEAAAILLEHPLALADLANFYTFRRLELVAHE